MVEPDNLRLGAGDDSSPLRRGNDCICGRTFDNRGMSTDLSSASDSATSPTLLEQVARQDPQAWQQLVRLYGPLVFHWARRQGLGQHDAADVLQDVFASVARSIGTFQRWEGSSFRSWLWTITRNQTVTWFRTRAMSAQAAGGTQAWIDLANVAESLPDDPGELTEHSALTALHRRGLEIVKSEFEERTWQIFWRATVDEVPTRDVAEEFEITANAVRQAKSRVLRRLRQVLGETM